MPYCISVMHAPGNWLLSNSGPGPFLTHLCPHQKWATLWSDGSWRGTAPCPSHCRAYTPSYRLPASLQQIETVLVWQVFSTRMRPLEFPSLVPLSIQADRLVHPLVSGQGCRGAGSQQQWQGVVPGLPGGPVGYLRSLNPGQKCWSLLSVTITIMQSQS